MSAGTSDFSSRQDGDLQFLTDTAYYALLDHESVYQSPSKGKGKQDGLFLERVDSFIEGQLKDTELFATREQRPLDEIRKLIAISHAKYLFSSDLTFPPSVTTNTSIHPNPDVPSIRHILSRISTTLQYLRSTAGLDSLLLVVSSRPVPQPGNTAPHTNSLSAASGTSEASWIGGTDLGKEFWMGLKGGGLNGARAFRVKSQMQLEVDSSAPEEETPSTPVPTGQHHVADSTVPSTRKIRSGDVKTELNAAVRQALRRASGNSSAEMRWTKPASLGELYNVQLVGWPRSVPVRNPSNNNLKDNRLLLDLVQNGKLKFIKGGNTNFCPMVQDPSLDPMLNVPSQHNSGASTIEKEEAAHTSNRRNVREHFGKSVDVHERTSQDQRPNKDPKPTSSSSSSGLDTPLHYDQATWSHVMSAASSSVDAKRKSVENDTPDTRGAKKARPDFDKITTLGPAH